MQTEVEILSPFPVDLQMRTGMPCLYLYTARMGRAPARPCFFNLLHPANKLVSWLVNLGIKLTQPGILEAGYLGYITKRKAAWLYPVTVAIMVYSLDS